MKQVMVRYRARPERVAENEELIREVYRELADADPEGLRYVTFRLEDGVSFMHVAETDDQRNPLPELAAFKRFQAGIRERCVEPPVVTELSEIGAYRLFGASPS
jgi:hypothetical protein